MISSSTAYKTQIKESGHFPEFAAELHFADSTVLELTSADFMAIPAPQISFGTSRPGVFDVGIATMKTFSCLLNNFSGKFDGYDFTGAVFYPKEGLTLTDTTVEYLTLGKFTVDECERLTKTIRIVAVDDMYKLEKDYNDGHHICPATVQEMFEDICDQCLVTWDASPLLVYGNLIVGNAEDDTYIIDGTCDVGAQEIGGAAFNEDFGSFTNSDVNVAIKPYGEGLTYRDVLSWICTMACCNAWITPAGQLHLGWYKDHETLNYYASIPLLRSAGTAADTVATNGTYAVNVGKQVFDGSESWVNVSGNTHKLSIATAAADAEAICSHFAAGTSEGQFDVSGTDFIFYTDQDLATFKTWLATQSVTLNYELATPVVTTLTTYLGTALTLPAALAGASTQGTPTPDEPSAIVDTAGYQITTGESLYELDTYRPGPAIAMMEYEITGVQYIPSDMVSPSEMWGSTTGWVYEIGSNQLLAADTYLTMMDALSQALIGFKFRPFTVSAFPDFTIEAGDTVLLTTPEGTDYTTIVTNVIHSHAMGSEVFADAETPSANMAGTYSTEAKMRAIAASQTEIQMNAYEEQMMLVSAAINTARGFYETRTYADDGITILELYQHDAATVATSTYVTKYTAEGVGYSHDGGANYTTVINSTGLTVPQLVARVVTADLIRAGKLESMTGDTYFDLDNDKIHLEGTVNGKAIVTEMNATEGFYVSVDGTKKIYIDTSGNATFSGTMSAASITSGSLESVSGDTHFDLDNAEIYMNGGANGSIKMNPTDGIQFLNNSGVFIGGVASVGGALGLIAQKIAGAANPTVWGQIGAITGGGLGFELINKTNGMFFIVARLVDGGFSLLDKNEIVRFSADDNLTGLYDEAGEARFAAEPAVTRLFDAAGGARFYADATTTRLRDAAGVDRFYSDANLTRLYDEAGEARFSADATTTRLQDEEGVTRFYADANLTRLYDADAYERLALNNASNYSTLRAKNGASYNEIGVDGTGAYKIVAGTKTYL